MTSLIMIVDDDPAIQRLATMVLHRLRYAVVAFDQPIDALEVLEHVTPDLFIIDYMMPRINGLELCQRIRSCDSTATVPIIMLSAQYNSSLIAMALKAGANACLSKNAIQSQLPQHIHTLLTVENAQC